MVISHFGMILMLEMSIIVYKQAIMFEERVMLITGMWQSICKVLIKFQICFIDKPNSKESKMFATIPVRSEESSKLKVDFITVMRAKSLTLFCFTCIKDLSRYFTWCSIPFIDLIGAIFISEIKRVYELNLQLVFSL